MSDSRFESLISEIEENDLGFTGLWSERKDLECGTLFYNASLPDDPFFDKLTNVTCTSETMMHQALEIFRNHSTKPFISSLNYHKFEESLKKQNFRLYDTQHVLKKVSSLPETTSVHKIEDRDSRLWSNVFCSAYDCNDWLETVNGIVRRTLGSVDYYTDESSRSCVALYPKGKILGLYCLGTIPSARRMGLARKLIDFSLSETVRRKTDFLMLETYARDKLLDFYRKLGFEEIYQKKIYSI